MSDVRVKGGTLLGHLGRVLNFFEVWWHGTEPPHTIQLGEFVYVRLDEPDGTPVRRAR
ncbi:MAG: hypothetical protein J6D54_13635 [Olsenella sp.]|nr:hypothetical protein [Olsenella sp.]